MNRLYALKNLKKQLEEISQEESYDVQSDYNNIWNACAEYDNCFNDLYLCDYVQEQDIVTEDEVVENLLPQNDDDLARLRCFINTTYDDSIYRIDGYGNLDNVSRITISDLCDELITMVDREIKELDEDEEM